MFIGVLYAIKRAPSYKDYVDSSLIFGTPIVAFALQSSIAARFDYGIAISAFLLAGCYIVLTQFLWTRYREQLRLLSETFLSLGVIFATLAIPFAIDGTLTGATWAIEGAGILWLSIRQQHIYRRLFGIFLIVASGLMLAAELLLPLELSSVKHADTLFSNSAFIGCLIIAFAANVGSWLLSQPYTGKRSIEPPLQWLLLTYGIAVLLLGFEYQIQYFDADKVHGISLSLLSIGTMLAYTLAARRLEWLIAYQVSTGFIGLIVVASFLTYLHQDQLAQNAGYVIWLSVFVVAFFCLYQARHYAHPVLTPAAHILLAATLSGILLWEGLWQLLLGYALSALVLQQLILRKQWHLLSINVLFFFPVLIIVALGAVLFDGDLHTLSSLASSVALPFAPGSLLWPFAFAVYFYCLYHNRSLGYYSTRPLVYGGGFLIVFLLFWLGPWPLLLISASLAVLCIGVWEKYDWRAMRTMGLALLPIMLGLIGLKLLFGDVDPASLYSAQFNWSLLSWQAPAQSDYALWALSFAVLFWTFWRCDRRGEAVDPLLLSGGLLFIGLWLTWKASWHILDFIPFMHGWHLALLPLTSIATLYLLKRSATWPFTREPSPLLIPTLTGLLLGWSLLQLLSAGDNSPLPWLPLVNPIDIVQGIILLIAYVWIYPDYIRRFVDEQEQHLRFWVISLLSGFIFVWANVELLRGLHHWGETPWEWPTIVSRYSSQTTLSLFWACCGLAVTVYANRQGLRKCWLVGAGLLSVVVFKLFVVDLSAQGTIERIISFTGVGLLLTLVGYFAPIPPQKNHEQETVDDIEHDEEKST